MNRRSFLKRIGLATPLILVPQAADAYKWKRLDSGLYIYRDPLRIKNALRPEQHLLPADWDKVFGVNEVIIKRREDGSIIWRPV